MTNPTQWQWLTDAASRIPRLFQKVEEGNGRAESTLGVRVINGRHVRLYFVAEVVDNGVDPLASHASVNFPATDLPTPDFVVTPRANRKRKKRW